MGQIGERALVVWPLLVAETAIFGTAAFALLLSPVAQSKAVNAALAPLWRVLAVLAVIFQPLILLVGAANMGDLGLPAALPLLPEVLQDTHFGHVWMCGAPLTLALAVVAWAPMRCRLKPAMLVLLTGGLLLLGSLSSHAIDRGGLAVAIYFIHEIAASLWLGAVLGLWMGAARGGLGARWVALTAPRVSEVAGWTVAILILSGLYTAYYSLAADPRRLIESAYGRTLVDKVCAATLVLLIGAYNRYWLMPTVSESPSQQSLLRNVGIESALLIGVLGLAALLGNTPPAH